MFGSKWVSEWKLLCLASFASLGMLCAVSEVENCICISLSTSTRPDRSLRYDMIMIMNVIRSDVVLKVSRYVETYDTKLK